MTKKLFDEFNPVSSKQWKQKIQFDLKGADYNDKLIWNSNEGISVKPFYHSDDFESFPPISKTKASQWKICQYIDVDNEEQANLRAISSVKKGAESLWFVVHNSETSIHKLLENIDLNAVTIHMECKFQSSSWVQNARLLNSKGPINVFTDPIGNLAQSGNWYANLNQDFSDLQKIVESTSTLLIDSSVYQNAGANMNQQLAYILAHSNEYLNYLNKDGIAMNEMTPQSLKIFFKVSIGTNYFFEIAKLKALRKLWSILSNEYKVDASCEIIAIPTKRNKTIYDYNVNMLRTTTECMSAILGGANTICNLPYDSIYHRSNEFADRIAINQLLILRYESYFDKVDNPSDGSYYIESVTEQLVEKALVLFKDIESNGGFLKQLKAATVQRKIKESAHKEQEQFNKGEEVLLGTNKYPNPNDRMKDDIELSPFQKKVSRKTLIEPIIEKRLAESIENQRLKTEN